MKNIIILFLFLFLFIIATASCGSDGDEPSSKSEIVAFSVNGASFNMVNVKGGTFQMGATEGQPVVTNEHNYSEWGANIPVHQVTLSNYSIGQTEVTLELWYAVMGSVPSSYDSDYAYAITNKLPVTHISWNDALAFIFKLNELTGKKFRLPTEAEWEFAARGGNESKGYLYSGGDDPGQVAWHSGNSSKRLQPVATKIPNELKIYDMSGNVTEFCSDFLWPYTSEPQTNPQGPSTSRYDDELVRVERGGDAEGGPGGCYISLRGGTDQDSPNDFKGFRLAL